MSYIPSNMKFNRIEMSPAMHLVIVHTRGHDSVIRRMKSLVCVSIDSVCVFSTFALELEDKQGRERWKGMSWSYHTSYAFRQL